MLKKILLFMSLLFLFLATTFAAGTHKAGDVYDPNNQVVQDTIGKQDSIGTITADEYKKVAEHFTDLDGKPMKKDRVDALVSDGKIGDVTRFLLEQREGKSDVESLAAADKQNQDLKAAGAPTIKTDNKKEDKCSFDPDAKVTADDPYSRDIRHNIEECITGSSLVQPNVKLDVTSGGLKTVLNGWIQKIAGFLALGAMFAIAFGSLKLTLSRGEDENIKKAKDIIKWGILGFLAVISAGLLIATVVNLIYSLAG